MLLDGTEFEIPCKNGKHTTSEELRELVARRIGLAPEYVGLFTIWVMSGSLSTFGDERAWCEDENIQNQ